MTSAGIFSNSGVIRSTPGEGAEGVGIVIGLVDLAIGDLSCGEGRRVHDMKTVTEGTTARMSMRRVDLRQEYRWLPGAIMPWGIVFEDGLVWVSRKALRRSLSSVSLRARIAAAERAAFWRGHQ